MGLDGAAQEMKALHTALAWRKSLGKEEPRLIDVKAERHLRQLPAHLPHFTDEGRRWGLIKGHCIEVESRREKRAVESQIREPAHEKWKGWNGGPRPRLCRESYREMAGVCVRG